MELSVPWRSDTLTGMEDRRRLECEESKRDKVVTDVILEREDKAIPSVESVTTKYGYNYTSSITPSSDRGEEAAMIELYEEDIRSDLPGVEDSMVLKKCDNRIGDKHDDVVKILRGEKNDDEVRVGEYKINSFNTQLAWLLSVLYLDRCKI